MENLYVFVPAIHKFVPAKEWLLDESDPTSVDVVGIGRPDGTVLAIMKHFIGENDVNFKDAQDAAGAIKIDGIESAFRCPTRKECIDIYDARFSGLDDLLKKVGGDGLKGWWWTSERDTDPRYSVDNAWYFHGAYGYLSNTSLNRFRCQAVTLCRL